MGFTRSEKYKADIPENTILKISTILNEKLGILLNERTEERDNLFVSRVSIANNNLMPYNIGTEGKGMSFAYALASAYGEFIERVQNQKLFFNKEYQCFSYWSDADTSEFYNRLKNENLLLKYRYAPDEKYVYFSKGDDLISKYINPFNLEEIEEYYNQKSLTLLPFYSVFEKKTVDLPFEILEFSSIPNGVCAGNTPLEALLHGFSEILERYVLKKIYTDNIVFPSIPQLYFKNFKIYDIIKSIENKYNWEIDIKDCSCNMGLPVIGILIVDKKNHMYKFHIGADPSPITALERSLTELYQNGEKISMLPINLTIQHKLLSDKDVKEIEYFKSHNQNMGYHHINLFSKKPNYEFSNFNLEWGISDESDIELMIELFRKLNTNIYIRDVSFLGFPSYFIYVPSISESNNLFSNNFFNVLVKDYQRLQATFRNIEVASINDIEFVIDFLTSKKYIPFKPFYNSRDLWKYYDKNLLLSLLYNLVNKKDKAFYFANKYLKSKSLETDEYLFFSCYRDALLCDESHLLNLIYPKGVIDYVLEFSLSKNFLRYVNYSTCFDCKNCKIRETCNLIESFKINKRVEIEYENNIPDQSDLFQLFNQIIKN